MDLKQYIALVPDWPKKGVMFKDVTPLMNDGEAFKYATHQIVQYAKDKHIDLVVGLKRAALLSAARSHTNLASALPRSQRRQAAAGNDPCGI